MGAYFIAESKFASYCEYQTDATLSEHLLECLLLLILFLFSALPHFGQLSCDSLIIRHKLICGDEICFSLVFFLKYNMGKSTTIKCFRCSVIEYFNRYCIATLQLCSPLSAVFRSNLSRARVEFFTAMFAFAATCG